SAGNLNDIKAQFLASLQVTVDSCLPARQHIFDKAAGGDHHVVRVTDVDELSDRLSRHKGKGATRELQDVHVDVDRVENVLEITLAHGRVLRPGDFGDAATPRLSFALVHSQKVETAVLSVDMRPSHDFDRAPVPHVRPGFLARSASAQLNTAST